MAGLSENMSYDPLSFLFLWSFSSSFVFSHPDWVNSENLQGNVAYFIPKSGIAKIRKIFDAMCLEKCLIRVR